MNFFENKFLRWFLLPLSWIYRLVIFLRNKFYDWRIFKTEKLACPVICVGNITVGGTGKTPIVQYLAEFIRDRMHRKVVILSRGYKRQSRGTVIVADGRSILVTPQQAGDEPYLLAQRLQTIPIGVDEDRVRGGRALIRLFQPDVILLDDGFQHRRLARNLNIAVFNGQVGLGNGYLLPAGPLREPVGSLKRADRIWLNQVTESDRALSWQKELPVPKGHYLYSNYQVTGVRTIPGGEHFPPVRLTQKKILAFSGIANPERFRVSLEATGAVVAAFLTFPDHHAFSATDLTGIETLAGQIQPDWIVTTEKDAMRLPVEIRFSRPFFFLEIKLIVNNEDSLQKLIESSLA